MNRFSWLLINGFWLSCFLLITGYCINPVYGIEILPNYTIREIVVNIDKENRSSACPNMERIATYLILYRTIVLCKLSQDPNKYQIAINHEFVHAAQHCLARREGHLYELYSLQNLFNLKQRRFWNEKVIKFASQHHNRILASAPGGKTTQLYWLEAEAYYLETDTAKVKGMYEKACRR